MTPGPFTPGGLTADTPRAARFTPGAQALRLLLLLVAVFVVALFLWWAAQDFRELGALEAHGQTAAAQITGKHIEGGGRSTTGYTDYTFYANGVQVDDKENIALFQYDQSPSSGTLPVTFLPSHPQTHRVGAVTQGRIQHQGGVWIFRVLGACVFWGLLLPLLDFLLRQRLGMLRDG